jgi:hypothetical protein
MRVLLDECLPRKLKYNLLGHDCLTVPEAGFAGKRNGVLLGLAEQAGFEIFVTMDKGLEYQQNLTGRRIAALILVGKSNRLADLLPLASHLVRAISVASKGEVVRVSSES